jgi:hypothetical protein
MMPLLALLMLVRVVSPSDSVRSLVSVHSIPERALLFAELAARTEGGDAGVRLGSLLELAGEFEDARRQYGLLLASGPGPQLRNWLRDRRRGSSALDTLLLLRATVRNTGRRPVRDLEVMMPLPRSHPPFQSMEIVRSCMVRGGTVLRAQIDSLPAGADSSFTVLLHLQQVPGSFRPLPDSIGSVGIALLLDEASSVSGSNGSDGFGPCLSMARELRARMAGRLELAVVGGVVRRGDSLVFHAWNLVAEGPLAGMPVDPLLLGEDSLRGIGHCPTDLIPLWNLLDTGGSELSVVCPAGAPGVRLGMEAALGSPRE